MKAAILTGPRTFEVREVPTPSAPADGLVLEVQACGVCGSDLRRWREGPPAGITDMIPGHEVSGIVVEVGPQVKGYSLGDRLAIAPDIHCGRCWYCERGQYNLCDNIRLLGITPGYPGGFAERMVLTGEVLVNGIVHHVPAGLSDEFAAMAEPCSSVLAAHAKAQTGIDDRVVIIGSGPIGCLHVAVAKARGAATCIIDVSAQRLEMSKRFEPDLTLDGNAPGPGPAGARLGGRPWRRCCRLRQSGRFDADAGGPNGTQGRPRDPVWRPAQGQSHDVA